MSDCTYDSMYCKEDYFNNRKWINRIYVKNLIRKAGLPKKSTVLDVGCGQGHFSYLFNQNEMTVLGIDLCETGVLCAQKQYEGETLHFAVCDAFKLPASTEFDCIFTRSLSLYNTDCIEQIREITRRLMDHVTPDGLFIFSYNQNFSKKKKMDEWKVHSLRNMKLYFSEYQNRKIYFSSKADGLLFGKWAFNPLFSQINICASRYFGLGGEMVCFIKKPK